MDKSFAFFYSGDKVNELVRLLNSYKSYSSSYLTSLSVRQLAAQLSGALPVKADVAQARLTDLQKELDTWKQSQIKFYDLVEARIHEMDGIFRDDKARSQFLEGAKSGRQETDQRYSRLNLLINETQGKIKTKNLAGDLPLKLVVTLDNGGKVTKVSKLVS